MSTCVWWLMAEVLVELSSQSLFPSRHGTRVVVTAAAGILTSVVGALWPQ